MTWPARLKLRVWAPVITGEGEALTLKLESYRRGAHGETTWRGEVVLELDRHFVRQIAEQVRDMQNRDRARLARERARIDREVEPLRASNTQETT